MANIQDITTQQLICGALGITLILTIIFEYDTEIVIAIISGLIGFLTNSKVDQDKITETIQESVTTTLEDTTTDTGDDTEPAQTIISSEEDDGVDTDGA